MEECGYGEGGDTMSDKVRQDFEAWALDAGYYVMRQGDGYLTETQYAFEGYQAGRAAERAEIVAKLESEEVIELMCKTYWGEGKTRPYESVDDAFKAEMQGGMREMIAAITKILEVI